MRLTPQQRALTQAADPRCRQPSCYRATSRPAAGATSRPWPAWPRSTGPRSTAPGLTRPCGKTSNTASAHCSAAGQHADPRDGQIARLASQLTALTARLATRDATITELTAFKQAALSRLAAQHDEITRLRRAGGANVRRLPQPPASPHS